MMSAAVIDGSGRLTREGMSGPVPWWSFTKTVIAVAALRLVARGVLSLHQPVAPHDFTLAQLLRHEAGLPDYGSLPAYQRDVAAGATPWPFERILIETGATDAARRLTGWTYSNIGYRFVADLVTAVSGLPLAGALQALALGPAGLAAARLAERPEDLAAVAMGDVAGYHPGWVYHGLLVGPVSEAAQFLAALLQGQLLDAGLVRRMVTPLPLPQFGSALRPDPAYGYGLMIRATAPSAHPIGHSGAGPGSRIAVYAADGRVAAVWASTAAQMAPEEVALSALGRDTF